MTAPANDKPHAALNMFRAAVTWYGTTPINVIKRLEQAQLHGAAPDRIDRAKMPVPLQPLASNNATVTDNVGNNPNVTSYNIISV